MLATASFSIRSKDEDEEQQQHVNDLYHHHHVGVVVADDDDHDDHEDEVADTDAVAMAACHGRVHSSRATPTLNFELVGGLERKPAVSKRLKRHGKKGRKARDKNPYEDVDSMTCISSSSCTSGAMIAQGKKERRFAKHAFTRVTLPHHTTYSVPLS